MKYLTGNQIRQLWLDFFKNKGHEIIPSADRKSTRLNSSHPK